jgi:hypothetical protein
MNVDTKQLTDENRIAYYSHIVGHGDSRNWRQSLYKLPDATFVLASKGGAESPFGVGVPGDASFYRPGNDMQVLTREEAAEWLRLREYSEDAIARKLGEED